MSDTRSLILEKLEEKPLTKEEIVKELRNAIGPDTNPKMAVSMSLSHMQREGLVQDSGGKWSLVGQQGSNGLGTTPSRQDTPPRMESINSPASLLGVMSEGKRQLSDLQLTREPFTVVFTSSPIVLREVVLALYAYFGRDSSGKEIFMELDPEDCVFCTGPEAMDFSKTQTINRDIKSIIAVLKDGTTREMPINGNRTPVTKAKLEDLQNWLK